MKTLVHPLLAALLLCLSTGAQDAPPSAFRSEPPQGETPAPTPPPEEAAPPLAEPNAPSLRSRIAQLMLATMEGQKQPNVQDMAFLSRYTPAGAIVDHALHPDLAQAYVAKLKGVEQMTGIPLWVGADLYRLTRAERSVPSAFLQIPSPLAAGASYDEDIQRRLGVVIADHLKAMGFNLHLGPSLSLAPSVPGAAPSIQYFGSDPKAVARCGELMLAEMIAAGVDVAPMGFPGGAFNREPRSPAALVTPESLLMENDLLPYVRAIAAGAPIIHVAPTLVPTIDSSARPACLSAAVMTTLLRGTLGFEGVIMAGPLDAPELTAQYDPADSALLALRSGADLLYFQTQPSLVMRVVDKLAAAVEQGLLDESVIDAAMKRVLAAKLGVDAAKRPVPDSDDSRQLERRKDLREEILAIERHSITVLQNRGGLLPLDQADGPIAVTGVFSTEAFKDQLEEYLKPISQQPLKSAQHGGRIPDFEIDRLTRRIRGLRCIIAVLSDSIEPRSGQELIAALRAKGAAVVVVVLGHPGNAVHYRDAEAIVLGYCDAATYGMTLNAVAEVIMGEAPVAVVNTNPEFTVKALEQRTYDLSEIARSPVGLLPVTLDDVYRAGRAVSYNTNEAVKSAVWDFGDGTRAKENAPVHAYAAPGKYPVTLTVTDTQKNESSGAFSIVVVE